MKTADVRESFLSFFEGHGHRRVPSSLVIPFDDPTILFINAGMNQFKDVFTGRRKVEYKRATSSQKCIRAGGKHNDLDNVGFTARHLTFFEMLGNFSFGDYYKEEAITFAWEWATKVVGLKTDRLYASVYEEDDDAYQLWEKIAPELKNGRILRFGKKDNYWSMGDVGPCGPCSELHYDYGPEFGTGPDDVVNGETERFVEIWNLVFMQYDQLPDGRLVDLPNPSVDTGAGLERNAAVLQGVSSVFDTDIFTTLIEAVSDITHAKYTDHVASHRVVADHVRSLAFAIADGAGISNEGRGYVLRRILRRAARHGRQLGAYDPFIYKLVPVLVDLMGSAFPEIKEKQQHVMNVIRSEEEAFGRTLDTGLDLLDGVMTRTKSSGGRVIPGEDVFKLYDTYGFPYDLTEVIAQENGLALDRDGFDRAMAEQQERSRSSAEFGAGRSEDLDAIIEELDSGGLDKHPPTEFVRDRSRASEAQVVATAVGNFPKVAIVVDRSPFYVEAGGQISDVGVIRGDGFAMSVSSMVNYQDHYLHVGKVTEGDAAAVKRANEVRLEINAARRWDTMRNHTATHLAHATLRQVLGEHVKQSGSYVGPDRLRFDFSHHQPMTPEEIDRVEEIVNAQILEGTDVKTEIMDIDSARKSGAMALFGEKYADTVRVVSVPGFSKELCGGTHVQNVSQIGPFFITVETGVASGVRRIEAITGREAQRYMLDARRFRRDSAALVGRPESEALKGIEQLKERNAELQRELRKAREAAVTGKGTTVGTEQKVGELIVWSHDFGESNRETMAAWIDSKKELQQPVVAAAVGAVNGKVMFVAGASNDAVKRFKVHIGNVARSLLPQFGGQGGGKPSFAQGSVAKGIDSADLFAKISHELGTGTGA